MRNPHADVPAKQRTRKELRAIALSLAAMGAGGILAATLFALLAGAWTWVQLGLAGFALIVAGVAAVFVPRTRRVAAAITVIAVLRLVVAVAPRSPVVASGSFVKTRFVGAPATLWFQGIPERETVRLGAWVGLMRDEQKSAPAIDAAYADLQGLFEKDESPLLDSWFFDREHYWLAAPRTNPEPQRVPLIVFVHGNGGTFQFYPYLLARAAVSRGFAVAFPSNGFGNWGGRDAADRIARVVDAVAREVLVDRERVTLVGLSAGVPGVMDTARLEPSRYRNVVAISGIFPRIEECRTKARVTILHGTRDARAHIEEARRAREVLVANGVGVDFLEEDVDHLAVLTRKETWVPRILDAASR